MVKPYQQAETSKKEQVIEMFDNISERYDAFNHLLTFGIDILWRKKAVKMLSPFKPVTILDVATGTGDFAIQALSLKPQKIIGIDISEKMLEVGKRKIKKISKQDTIEMLVGDSENLPFADNTFDAITIGFGVRNFENLTLGLSEVKRVLKPGGSVVILEPSYPNQFPMKQLFNLYFKAIIPMIGKILAKDKFAYTYLPNSVKSFPARNEFLIICEQLGFKNSKWYSLTFGSCIMYTLQK